MDNIKSTLRFINYYVNKVELYNNNSFEDSTVEIDFDITKEIEYIKDEENTALVTLNAAIFKNAIENNYPFSMNISITGIFQIDNDDIGNMERLAELNSVAILFPYLRSIVSIYTTNANIQPLILPPVNVIKMIEGNE